MMNTIQMYDAQADIIKVVDIATNRNNRIILQRIMKNENDYLVTSLQIQNQPDEDEEDDGVYDPEGAKDMGWLGYFIGKNEHLRYLCFSDFTPSSSESFEEVLEPFCNGISRNKSIQILSSGGMDLLGGRLFTMMVPFFKNNNNLDKLNINECDNWGEEGSRLLALALGSCCNSLTELTLMDNNISDDGLVDIITSLSMYRHLSKLDLDGNRLNKHGSSAMATLLKCSVTRLRQLDLASNELNDESIHALVPGLKSCSNLHTLRLSRNELITSKGWQHLATVLAAPNSNIRCLVLAGNNVDDEAAAEIARFLVNNIKLVTLNLNSNQVNAKGWKAFSKLLCDTSSVNSIFLSNHTLTCVTSSADSDTRASLQQLFVLNDRENKKQIAMIKILQHHNDFDMMPFFEWEFKVLPLIINWFERASEIPRVSFNQRISQGKLSSIYQFVRAMPDLYVKTYLMKELEYTKAAQKQKEEELVVLEER